MRRPRKQFVWFAVIGAFSFWSFDVVIHALRQQSFSTSDVHLVTKICPTVTVVIYGTVVVWMRRHSTNASMSLAMLLGIWMSGPLAMIIASSFSKGGFASDAGFLFAALGLILCTIFFPFASFMMATYDGSLYALYAVTAFLFVTFLLEQTWKFIQNRAAPTR